MGNYKYILKDVAKHNQEVIVLELADNNGQPVFNYKPGQYVMIAYVNDKGVLEQRHAFSIASSPTQNSHLMLGIKIGGTFTRGLLNLKIGTPISVSGPYGKFIFNPAKHQDTVMLAGGIGITPFLSAMTFATDNKLANKIALLYSARTVVGASFLNEIKQLELKNPNLKTLLSITDEKILAGTTGIIGERINSNVIKDFVGSINGKTFFICGPVPFMEACKNNLLALGVNEAQIKMEAFSMMDDNNFWPQLRNFSYATGFSAAIVALVFYSIVNASSLTKSLKSSNNFLNPAGLIKFFGEEDRKGNTNVNTNTSNVNTSNVNTPTPTTSVSGVTPAMPAAPASSNNQNSNSLNQTNNSSLPSSTPQPITSSSIPVQSQRQTTPIAAKSTNTVTKNSAVTPAPITASSTPINQNNINNAGYRDDDGEFDD